MPVAYVKLFRILPALLTLPVSLIACIDPPLDNEGSQGIFYRVSRIIDGDTIALSNGQHVRYLGIDCPELHPQNRVPECGSSEATEENRKIIGGSRIRLETDVTDKDNYGRLLRYVYTESGVFVNYELVRRGWGQVFPVPPDAKYQASFMSAQMLARQENRGLWGKCLK